MSKKINAGKVAVARPLPPKLQAFVSKLRSGWFTQPQLAEFFGYSPKSVSNLISTVHNNPKFIQKDFTVRRNEKTGLREYHLGGEVAKKPRKSKKTEAPAQEPAPAEVQAEAPAPAEAQA